MPLRDHFREPLDLVTSWDSFDGQYVKSKGILRCQCDVADGFHHDPTTRSHLSRRTGRDPLLRHSPLRPAYGAR